MRQKASADTSGKAVEPMDELSTETRAAASLRALAERDAVRAELMDVLAENDALRFVLNNMRAEIDALRARLAQLEGNNHDH